jgi:hypothetical protein
MPAPTESALLYKHAHVSTALTVKSGRGLYLTLENGQQILDATSGAGVTAIGHGDSRVKAAVAAQLDEIAYVHPGFYKTTVAERLADFLVESTKGKMARAVLVGSGTLPRLEGETKWLADDRNSRFRSRGSCHEARPTVFSGIVAAASDTNEVHCP